MSRDGSIVFDWADGEYRFRLGLAQLRELQEKCDAGPDHIRQRIETGTWRVDDLRETLRLGLIGGGLAPEKALGIVKRYVDGRPLYESRLPAQIVLMAALVGAGDEDLGGKAEVTEEAPEPTSREESSLSSPSTASAPASDLPPSTSMP
jgi:hypothetical protein